MTQTVVTYCRICEAACGLLADVRDGEVTALRPDKDHVVSKGFVCAKGTRFDEVHRSPDRLDHPMVRRDGALVRQSWPDAMAEIGAAIRRIRREHGPHAVGMYVGNPAAFTYAATLLSHGLAKGLGTRNQFSAGSLDCSNKFVVAQRMFGYAATHPIPELDRARFALLIGTNPSVSQCSFVHAPRMIERLRGIVRRGGKVVVVDPRRTETVKAVGDHLSIIPDTDAHLLLSLLHVVFAEGLEDRAALDRYGHDEDELRRIVAEFSPQHVAEVTGIEAARIRDLAREFAAADGAFCHVSTGVNQGRHGNIAYAAKIALELATGNLDRPGGTRLPRGALDVARLVRLLGIDGDSHGPSRIGGFDPVLGAMPTAILADEILTPGPEQIRALIVLSGNPLLSAPDGPRLRRALQSLDVLVSIDLFVNDTAAHATHVLPGADWLERDDLPLAQLQLQPIPYVQYTEAVVPPKAERREDWKILVDLAKACGVRLWDNRVIDAAVRTGLRKLGPRAFVLPLLTGALGARPGRKLARNPHGVLVDRERPHDFLENRINTPSGRVELAPAAIYADIGELQAGVGTDQPPGDGGRVLRLFTKRERLGHNSWMHGNPALRTEQAAFIHPSDATAVGIDDGQGLTLTSVAGSISVPARITEDVRVGTVAVSHGYGHEPDSGWSRATARGGRNVNELAAAGPDAVDRLSGMCRFVGIAVRARPAAVAEQHGSRHTDPHRVVEGDTAHRDADRVGSDAGLRRR